MGLLDKAAFLHLKTGNTTDYTDQETVALAEKIVALNGSIAIDTADTYKIISTELNRLPQGIESPVNFFHLLIRELPILKASLLMYDPEKSIYIPWASIGFDKTTNYRMRISKETLELHQQYVQEEAVILEDPNEIENYRRLFSSREYFLLSKMIFVPLKTEKKIFGSVIITEFENDIKNSSELMDMLTQLAVNLSPVLIKTRESVLNTQKIPSYLNPVLDKKELIKRIEDYTGKNCPLYAFKFIFSDLLNLITQKYRQIDTYRLTEDMKRVMLNLISNLGRTYPLGQDAVLLLTKEDDFKDKDVITHQVSLILHKLFPELNKADGHIVKVNENIIQTEADIPALLPKINP